MQIITAFLYIFFALEDLFIFSLNLNKKNKMFLFRKHKSSTIFTLIERNKWKEVIDRCNKRPCEAQSINEGGWLPIHSACFKKAPLNVIKHLYNIFPEGIRYKSSAGWLPIDICMAESRHPQVDVIIFLHSAAKL